MSKAPLPRVVPGQVWEDNDHRIARRELPRRQLRVTAVDETHATVEASTLTGSGWGPPRVSRIRLDRFRPTSTGYRLVQDA